MSGAGGKVAAKTNWQDKIAEAKKSGIENSPGLFYVWMLFASWAVVTACTTFLMMSGGHKIKRFDRGFADLFYVFAALSFAIAVAFSFIAYLGARTDEKRALTMILCAVNAIAMFSYCLQILRLTPTTMDHVGNPVDPARFLEWISTCPVLIYLIGEITKTQPYQTETVKCDFALIIAGYIASVLKQPYSEIFATISSIYFFYAISNIMDMYDMGINRVTECKVNTQSLIAAKTITRGAWWGFTSIWYIQRSGVISYATGEALFVLADIFAKVFLTLILVNATVDQVQSTKISKIENITNELEEQMQKSDTLLGKLIPKEVLDQLKSGKGSGVQDYESVTVFFSDIANFTVISSRTSTKDMLATLNKMWVEYDASAKKWGMYKVETIGDAYLGVVGAPERVPDHVERACNFSIDIMEMIKNFTTVTNEKISIRIGLMTGPVTGGILGESNPHWCIIGDTVGLSSKMESSSKPGMIHIHESTWKVARNKFNVSAIPEPVEIKGMGTQQTYWLYGR